ncbi:hypothetical protein CWB98_00375 [Pseudoalteromonas rubra]|uniref:Uncharacterized protein n=1 Tax=Pseudoalteromonas rubra TaxID=43658 RepID=A0A5S3X5Y6_9GAMM|nr:hypothetical protein CWB98_00375 [Pseudoalteromonas rubra]
MTNELEQTYSALRERFKQIPHRVRDDNGVVVGGVVELGKPGAAAVKPHFACSNYVGSTILLAFMVYRAISGAVSCIPSFIQAHTTVIRHLMRDLLTGYKVRIASKLEQTHSAREKGLNRSRIACGMATELLLEMW